ncbi:hypothetical protein ASD97_09980 [Streptomyces sp. Root63]|uniref:DUF7417 domain-containing protein n=1 Tax=unclassified Streptomyces TaxID=2593676 RepID=UPI0007019294|nr:MULTISPECIES: hypothetical protein [unclassified Streptomyces]KQX37010.1 hypothetical protein ASD29_07250 [Streptomyces sp. Root1295]KRA43929.1 hypothetical protein ASD97_09980 [Streptomyces sp. Root63]
MGAMGSLVVDMMSYEAGELDSDDSLDLFSDLIKSGMAWKLQGHWGRTAKALIDRGMIDEESGDITPLVLEVDWL